MTRGTQLSLRIETNLASAVMLGNASTPTVTEYPPMTNISLLEEGILAAVHRCPAKIIYYCRTHRGVKIPIYFVKSKDLKANPMPRDTVGRFM